MAPRVLGLLCDDQYRPLQDYLRHQPGNIKDINLVSETCKLLSSLYVDITKDNITIINSVLQTLLKMSVVGYLNMYIDTYVSLHINCFTQGNFENQKVLFNHQIIDTINQILQMRPLSDEQYDPVHVCNILSIYCKVQTFDGQI